MGDVWVQDQGGGPYSGIHLSCAYGGTAPNCSLTQTQIDALTAGEVVNVTGIFTVYTPTIPSNAPSQIRLDAPAISPTGQTVAPVAMTVAASAVAKAQLGAASDPYKGVYVNVSAGGPYTVSSTTATEFQTSCPGDAGTTYNGFEAASGSTTLAIGLVFYDTVTYCMSGCGLPCPSPVTTQAFTSVAGIVEPSSNKNGAIYLGISPTLDSDLLH
ncbi:MAG TPA: hypothetical protein VLM85_26235 [Polyangiaceae bacterium]|nr:hypothetical protein [Polyangiaceae bacterium]